MPKTMRKSTLDFAEAIRLVSQGKPMTRKSWTQKRILMTNGKLMIQHDINQPGLTPWLFTVEDRHATDYVPAYFNSEDTTCPVKRPS